MRDGTEHGKVKHGGLPAKCNGEMVCRRARCHIFLSGRMHEGTCA